MNVVEQKNRDTVTKQQFADTMSNYLGTVPFDAERFAIIVQDTIQDQDMDLYIDDILHDYEQWESIDEVEVWSYVFEHNTAVFEDIFAAYYSVGYLRELVSLSEIDCQISSQISSVLDEDTPSRKDIKQRYVTQIQKAFDAYQSSAARTSLITGAQKLLVQELLQTQL